MAFKIRAIVPVAFLALSVASCSSSDSGDSGDSGDGVLDSGDGGVSDSGGSDGGGSDSGGSGDGGDGTGGSGTVPFFNDQSGFSFADSLGGKLSRLFSVGLGAVSGGSGGAFSDGVPGLTGKRNILATESSTQACDGGGTVALNFTTDDATAEMTGLGVSFNNCVQDGETSNGSLSISGTALSGSGDSGTVSITIDNFAITGTDPVAMNGQINASTEIAGDQTTATVNGSGLTMTAEGETINFSNYSVTAITNDFTGASSVSASLAMTSSVDGTITVDVNPALATSDDSDYPTSGTISMTHSDGSSLVINADTGNSETFSYVINENGATTSGTESWANTDIEL